MDPIHQKKANPKDWKIQKEINEKATYDSFLIDKHDKLRMKMTVEGPNYFERQPDEQCEGMDVPTDSASHPRKSEYP